jgi:hypothetical protein
MADAEEIAWAAGLFEGEGSITMCGRYVHLQLKSTDEDVVVRFHEVVGCGSVYGPYSYNQPDGYKRKPAWVWVCREADAMIVFRKFAPWLGKRRLARGRELSLICLDTVFMMKGPLSERQIKAEDGDTGP